MIISFKKRFIFIHVPKTAGESITEVLLDPRNGGGQLLRKHGTFAEAEDLLGSELSNFTFFAVIRNPFEQVVSFYEHLRKPLYLDHSDLKRQYPEFDGRLVPYGACEQAIQYELSDYVKSVYGSEGQPERILRDCCHWLTSKSGTITSLRILRYESIEVDFHTLAADLGIIGQLNKKNSSRYSSIPGDQRKYRRYYDDHSRKIIEKTHAMCLNTFGYHF